MREEETMLTTHHLTCLFDADHGIRDITLSIGAGERVGLIGANGAGKTTLLRCLVGLLPAEGTLTVAGLPMTPAHLPAIRRAVGYVLQDPDDQLFMPTVLEDMIFGPVNAGVPREEAIRRADACLAELGLTSLRGRQNHRLSGGEKKMASIAVILTMAPSILLFDEPSAYLDPGNRRRLISLLMSRHETQVIASHDLDMIAETCDRVVVMDKGRLVCDGRVSEVLTDKALLEAHGLELPFCLQPVPGRLKPQPASDGVRKP